MLHQGFVGSVHSGIRRWDTERARFSWGSNSSAVKRTFDEDLALFERQVRDEIQQSVRRPEATVGHASSSGPVS